MFGYYGYYGFGSGSYFLFFGLILLCAVLSMIASSKVNSTFKKFNKGACRSGMTGEQTVRRLMQMNGVTDIAVGQVAGELTDHYHPTKRVVNLSASTYDNNSVAAVAVAAHEVGHVMQKKDGYGLYLVRTALVPIVNFGARFSWFLVMIGLVLELLVRGAVLQLGNENLGFYIAMVGVILYGTSFLFSLVTLPVELNASRRAGTMLMEAGILREDELPAARKVLSAAAMTYLVSTLMSLVYFLRFLFYVLRMFGRNSRR